jgi:tetratricopeptide (TPR) repeat protein
MAALPHSYRDRSSSGLDQLLDYFLITTEAADERLRGLPPVPVTHEFNDRKGALAWLDAERGGLVGAVQMAADAGLDHAAQSLPLLLSYYLGFRSLFDDLLVVSRIGLDAARRLADRDAECGNLTNLGLALYGLRRWHEAVDVQREAVAIFAETGDRQGQAHTLNNLGLALHGVHRDDEAVSAHREAVAMYRLVGDRQGEGNALNNLGLALHALHRDDEAVPAYREAAAMFRETGERHGVATALVNVGNVLRERGRYEEAVTVYQEAAGLFRETGDRPQELATLENITAAREML